jgi:hypothetical protein
MLFSLQSAFSQMALAKWRGMVAGVGWSLSFQSWTYGSSNHSAPERCAFVAVEPLPSPCAEASGEACVLDSLAVAWQVRCSSRKGGVVPCSASLCCTFPCRAYPIQQYPCRTSTAAAIMHMIMNNLDPAVAQVTLGKPRPSTAW